MRQARGLICALALVAVPLPGAAAQQLPNPDSNGTYLFWNAEEQLAGYRNIEKIFPTLPLARGDDVAPLRKADRELVVTYDDGDVAMTTDLFMQKAMAAGLLVLHRGEIVLERYAHGYGPGQRWTSFSIAKSISSTLVGAAIRDGAIKGVDDLVTDYLPSLRGSAYDGVSIRHLLNMTSGVKWDERYSNPTSDVNRIRVAVAESGLDPIVAYMSKLPREAEPGVKWAYKTGETHLVGSLLRAATGKRLGAYLSEKIWQPYAMEADAAWMVDTAGNELAGCCISATLRDFGRFAKFFNDGAIANGHAVVPDGWTREATTTSSAAKEWGGYGYQWWTQGRPGWYQAIGIFGQIIFVAPDDELIIVIQSAWPSANDPTSNGLRGRYINAIQAAIAAIE